MQRIILASNSPRRRMLLEWAEVDFEIIVKHVDEIFPEDTPPEICAAKVARDKAEAVRRGFRQWVEGRMDESKHLPILAADTIVVLENQIIGKPATRDEAITILKQLSGKTHLVITGVCILTTKQELTFYDTTSVTFYELNDNQIAYYVDKYQPYDKAGAYAIQEWIGVVGIRSITGDFYNVMGLPVSKVLQALGQLDED